MGNKIVKPVTLLDQEANICIDEEQMEYIFKINVQFKENPFILFTKYADDACCLTIRKKEASTSYTKLWFMHKQNEELYALETNPNQALNFSSVSTATPSILKHINFIKEVNKQLYSLI